MGYTPPNKSREGLPKGGPFRSECRCAMSAIDGPQPRLSAFEPKRTSWLVRPILASHLYLINGRDPRGIDGAACLQEIVSHDRVAYTGVG
jgi:hypothetical protein